MLKWCKFKVPTTPYKIDKPNKKIHEIKDPNIKYFNPASLENAELRLKLVKI